MAAAGGGINCVEISSSATVALVDIGQLDLSTGQLYLFYVYKSPEEGCFPSTVPFDTDWVPCHQPFTWA
jgi:hypothetical protein